MSEKKSNGATVGSKELLAELGKMTRRWRRMQGGAGGACCSIQEANQFRNEGRLPLIKELEAFVKANETVEAE